MEEPGTSESGQPGTGPGTGPELSSPAAQKKRSRIRFSCTTCRDKKLKCDRQTPCDQCTKRGIEATCEFIPYVTGGPHPGPALPARHNQRDATNPATVTASDSHRSKPVANDSAVQARLRHLEHLVQVLKAQRRENIPAETSTGLGADGDDFQDDDLPRLSARVRETAGMILSDLRYVDASHWESILSDVLSITGSLERPEDVFQDDDDPVVPPTLERQGQPDLLLGGWPRLSVDELIRYLPPRPIADRLLARLFQAKEPGWIMFHMPSLLRHYEGFWENPSAMTYTELALLFAMFCNASLYYMKSREELPGRLGDAGEAYRVYKARCAQCLVLGDYTKPWRYKLEAMILYFGSEYLGQQDAHINVSVILSIIVRLAMHMGLHRDPKHYPDMSPFEGEMRRRLWTVLRDVDILIGFQFGLPGNIPNDLYDTALPRNLHDEDFDETTRELPPSRPETERTVTLWCIMKGRIVNVFSEITTAMSSRKAPAFADIMRLDRKLDELATQFPPSLRYRPFSQSVVDPVDVIMQRYQLELLFLKCRIVLHRRHMGYARKDKRYEHSRRVCLEAATRTLRHQYDVHCELQTGGRLSHERSHWFLSSLSTHNFLLADMILCLELWFLKARERSPEATSTLAVEQLVLEASPEMMTKDQILDILRTSRLIWQARRKESAEANKAFNILTKMLSMSTGESLDGSPESNNSAHERLDHSYPTLPMMTFAMETGPKLAAVTASALGTQVSPEIPTGWVPVAGQELLDGQVPVHWAQGFQDIPNMGHMDGLMDPNLGGDWTLWDNQILNSSDGIPQIPWDTFFQSGGSGF
ncbi:hypothetical protein QBC40DRAFT_289059 [Triangularia verruculosa]|uniref:Zn(2)-C6 fungal-type domain-containing protein n=1 Tax=Triangularia verruculosa TaxID=2587418 RepID=A0AAN6X7A7_9PEZI|nr:hypothetical protein QBC40DRAFT_289059 [Triangularia verruculosa]